MAKDILVTSGIGFIGCHLNYNNQYRFGDIRQCLADINKIKNELEYKPNIGFSNGIDNMIEWIKQQPGEVKDSSQIALNELKKKVY